MNIKIKIDKNIDISKIQKKVKKNEAFGLCAENDNGYMKISDVLHGKGNTGYGGPSFLVKDIYKDEDYIYIDIKYLSCFNGKLFKFYNEDHIIQYKLFVENNELLGIYGEIK
jgi:hypothetical protein